MKLKNFFMAAGLLLVAAISIRAQEQTMQLPLDPNVRIGKLPNGLTYYIRHNEWPEDRADFYIAQKVGSVQEEDNQKGLAHFLEHMCFNGTTNFPGDKLKIYLENIGVKFGENLNAYTSFDETVYNVTNVPIQREGAIDTCLLILHDWSHDLLLEDKEIDKERGVINEEWRMRRSAMLRMYENAFPELYKDSRYAYRMPIGTMDIVMNFPYEDLRSYYRKWYRPDLQAVIVVGDIDVNEIEQKIQAVFADIKMVENPATREYYPVPDNKEPIITVQKDKEQEQTLIYMMYKHENFPDAAKVSPQYYVYKYIQGAIAGMFADRFTEILQQENPPFLGANVSDENYLVSKTKGSLNGVAVCKDNGYKEALSTLYREMLRVSRYGFTVTEYERYKQDLKAQLDHIYAQKDKVYNNNYVKEYVRHFLDNEPMPGIEWEYENMKQIADAVPVEAVNQTFSGLMCDSNMVVAMFCPDKEGIIYPSDEELLGILKEVEAEDIEPYKEEVSTEPLVSEIPETGKIKKITDGDFGSKMILLSNGIKVYVKQTDYTPNAIIMAAQSWGGTSQYPDSEYYNSSNSDMVGIGGWGNFSMVELTKKLAGVQASVNPYVKEYTEGLSGSCVTKDFETMLQLVYLCFTAPRKDESAFNSTMSRVRASLANQELDPNTALSDTIAKVVYNNNVRAKRFTSNDVDKIDYDRVIEIYKERFADANDFDFFFVGDMNIDSVAPLIEKYLGALPVMKSKEKSKPTDYMMAKGELKNVFEKEQETPNARVMFYYHAPIKISLKNVLTVNMLKQIMTMVYTETVREDEGGAYGIPVNAGVDDFPKEVAEVSITLPTAPEKRERMTEIIYKGVEDMVANGPKEEFLQKVKEYMHRSHAEVLKNNGYWLNALMTKVRDGRDNVTTFDETVDAITAADIQKMAKTIFCSGNRIEVGMTSPVE